MKKVLIVEDEERMRELLTDHLTSWGYEVTGVSDGETALKKLKEHHFPIAIIDLRLPGMDGLKLLEKIKEIDPSTESIVITAYATVESAINALKKGARDYLTKPFKMEELRVVIEKAMEEKLREEENRYLKDHHREKVTFTDLVYRSRKMKEVVEKIKKVLKSEVTVLVTGESGTGKELVARIIHYESPRKEKPFVVVNCAALPETLLESELFGHEKGAFTGANTRKIGKFEFADGGSVFLDEIGEMPLPLQAKLLRFLQYKEFQRVGGNETIRVDVRIIAATNKDLKEEVKKGNFREDLYYRLDVFPIHLPSLRERKEDIPLLCENYLARRYPHKKISPEAMDLLLNYSWPGNVRELENVLERACLLSEGETILPSHISLPFPRGAKELSTLEEMEKNLIQEALKLTRGNQTRASELLGITRRTLIYRMKKYGINPKEFS
ncbi:sigma-54-dependent Fis family transcriptional regulator [Candidatus Calescamantes bacterium]|nr:sigma-54-dependent Fis family transcriptional regulator [Candidatus Calescamantes bacterium]